MLISDSPAIPLMTAFYATITLGFGIVFPLRPAQAVAFFGFPPPSTPQDRTTAHGLVVLYAIRDVFISVALYVSAWYGAKMVMGWLLVAFGSLAIVDGWVCLHFVGKGEWNHWGYGPVVLATGLVTLGVADW